MIEHLAAVDQTLVDRDNADVFAVGVEALRDVACDAWATAAPSSLSRWTASMWMLAAQ